MAGVEEKDRANIGGGAWKGVGVAAKERRHSCCGHVVSRAKRYVETRGGESLLAVDGKRRLSKGQECELKWKDATMGWVRRSNAQGEEQGRTKGVAVCQMAPVHL